MSEKVKLADLPEFDALRYLDGEEAVAEYLAAALEDGDPALWAAVLEDAARFRALPPARSTPPCPAP